MGSKVKKLVIVPEDEWQRIIRSNKGTVSGTKTVSIPLKGKLDSQVGSGDKNKLAAPPSPPSPREGKEVQPSFPQTPGEDQAGAPSPLPPLSPSQGKEGGRKEEGKGGGGGGKNEKQEYVDRKRSKQVWMPPGRRQSAPTGGKQPKKTWISL